VCGGFGGEAAESTIAPDHAAAANGQGFREDSMVGDGRIHDERLCFYAADRLMSIM
jgi:hypothetical protein